MTALLIFSLVAWLTAGAPARAQGPAEVPGRSAVARLFYSGQYEAAAAMALQLRIVAPHELSTYEQRTSALHFQLKRLLADSPYARDKKRALRECLPCGALLEELASDLADGRARARARLETSPDDVEAMFFLGKLDLTYVWVHNDTLGRRTGWGEYREARRMLERVLAAHPDHIRARVARAWIDYVVDTRVPWAFRWALGGGDRKGALAAMRETATTAGTPEERAEARFGLWEMLARDEQFAEAAVVARDLSAEYPANQELQRFIQQHAKTAVPTAAPESR